MTGAATDFTGPPVAVPRPAHDRSQGDTADPAATAATSWWRTLLVGACWVVGALQVLLGIAWWCGDLGMVPAYGDTQEYLRSALTLQADQYRTLGYPLLVRASMYASTWAGLPVQLPLYLLQTALAAAAAWYLARSLPWVSRRGAAAATAVVVTSPLVVHYATSLLSDSVASSLFVLALAGLGRVLVGGDRRPGTWSLTVLAALAAALLRPEKCEVLLALALVLIPVAVVARRRHRPGGGRRVAVAVAVLLVIPALLGGVINRATQTADLGRPQGLAPVLMSRVVWPHLAEIRAELPPVARAHISAADAATFDLDPNASLPMTERLRALDRGGDALTWAAVRAALRCCAVDVAGSTALSVAAYTAAPVVFAVEGVGHPLVDVPADGADVWNLTRMNAAHPTLTDLLAGVSLVLLGLLAAAALVGWWSRSRTVGRPLARRGNRVVLLVWFGTFLNGCFFAAASGAVEANARYTVSGAMVITCALAAWTLTGAQNAERHSRERRSVT